MRSSTFKVICFQLIYNFILNVLISRSNAGDPAGVQVSFFGDNSDLDIIHFDDEQSFMERFGDDLQVKIFNSTKGTLDNKIPGDLGMPVIIKNPSEEVQFEIEKGLESFGYNKYVSDLISVERRLIDKRNEWCFTPNRVSNILLPTSVIICFHNEALSVLLRTIYSIINRSPEHLLAEIIIIDDFSDTEETRGQLDEALRFFSKVKLFRLPKREGLIRARLLGAILAHAPVLTFMDSHVEVSKGWIEPLLDKVTKSWKTIAVPVFNLIDPKTFAIRFTDKPVNQVGSFKWNLMFTFKSLSQLEMIKSMESPADPIPSPAMPGGFFSIHRDFFDYLGKYDDQLEIWGGENIELSIKAWICGGRIEILPCSHVAHLERQTFLYPMEKAVRNTARVASVWLDEYSQVYFQTLSRKNAVPTDIGDISSRLLLKRKLNCSSFDWYLNNVAPDMFNPKFAIAFGKITSEEYGTKKFCLDSQRYQELPVILECSASAGSHLWYYTKLGEIRNEEMCLDYFGAENIVLYPCHKLGGNQEWEFHADTGSVVHSLTNLCLSQNDGKLVMQACQGKISQKWKFEVDKAHLAWNNFTFPAS